MPNSSAAPAPNPKTESTSTVAAQIKSLIRNILLASPEFPRLYADTVIAYAPNSNEAKILTRNYKKIVERTDALVRRGLGLNFDRTNPKSTNRTNMPNPKDCTHIKVTGARCGSPALRGEQFCYFHQRMLRTVKGPPASRVHHAALLEDEESIQASLIEVVNALLRGTIELKRAELILRALNTAVRNIRRVKFGIRSDEMVREVPAYPAVPDAEVEEAAAAEAARQATRAEIARVRAAHLAPANLPSAQVVKAKVTTDHVGTGCVETAHVGTGALARPGGPAVSGRSAVEPKLPAATPASTYTVPDPTQRKPPLGVKGSPAAKQRKIAAHRASGG